MFIDPLRGGAQRYRSRDVLRSRTKSAFMTSAVDLSAKLEPFANEKRTRALRGINFVPADCVNIGVDGAHVDGNFAGCLHAVGVKGNTRFLCDAADLLDRLNGSELVVDVHYAN